METQILRVRQILKVAAGLLLASAFVVGMAGPTPANHAQHFTPPQLFAATFSPYPTNGLGSGAVVLDVTVNGQGKIANVATIRGVPTLTAAAALQSWSFSAAIYGNTPVPSKVVVAMAFRNPATALPDLRAVDSSGTTLPASGSQSNEVSLWT